MNPVNHTPSLQPSQTQTQCEGKSLLKKTNLLFRAAKQTSLYNLPGEGQKNVRISARGTPHGHGPWRLPGACTGPQVSTGPTGAHRHGAAVASILPFQMPQLLNPQRMRLFSETAPENKVCAEAGGTSKMTAEEARGPSLDAQKAPGPSYLRAGTSRCFLTMPLRLLN